MKKIALIVLSLSFCFFVPLISIEFFLRAIPNDFNEKLYYLHRNKEKIEVLILGSSHTFVGVNPNLLKQPAFSFANSSQTLDLDELIFDRVKNKLPNLNTVIIPVSYFSYPLVLEDGTSHQKIKNYNIYYNLYSNTHLISNSFEIFHQTPAKNWKQIQRFYQNPRFKVTIDSTGFISKRYVNTKLSWNEKVKNAVKNHSLPMNNPLIQQRMQENTASLTRMLDWCVERNIKVILLSSPADSSYVNQLEKNQFEYWKNTTQRLSSMYNNVIWLNYLEDSSGFSREDFQDPDHLNEKGSQKLTQFINSHL